MIHVLSIHDIIRYSQKKMGENIFLYILYQKIDVQESVLFLHFQIWIKQKKTLQKIVVARFLDAHVDEKQVINLDRPYA